MKSLILLFNLTLIISLSNCFAFYNEDYDPSDLINGELEFLNQTDQQNYKKGDPVLCEIIGTVPKFKQVFSTIVHAKDINDFTYIPFNSNNKCINFKVNSKNGIGILLNSLPQHRKPSLEIYLGGWKNTQTGVSNEKGDIVGVVPTLNLFQDNIEFIEYWVSWENDILKIGNANDSNPITSYGIKNQIDIKFIGFKSSSHGTLNDISTFIIEEPFKCPGSEIIEMNRFITKCNRLTKGQF